MANSYYNASGAPSQGSAGSSATIRGEFNAIVAGFDKMPTLGGNGGQAVFINAGATGMESNAALSVSGSTVTVTGDLAVTGSLALTSVTLSGNLTVNGNTTLGNAAGDTLTIAPNAVTWSNNPTHSGNHTFSGRILLADGALATPSLAFSGATSTGFWQSAGVVSLSLAGVQEAQFHNTLGFLTGDIAAGNFTRIGRAGQIFRQVQAGGATLNFDGIAVDGTSAIAYQFGRAANTTGPHRLQVLRGDGTATTDHQFISGSSGMVAEIARSGGRVLVGSSADNGTDTLQVNGTFAAASSGSAAMLSLTNTNAGSTGVVMTSYANSASPANGDDVFVHTMYGEDSVGSQIPFATWQYTASNVSVGATQTTVQLQGRQGGSTVTFLQFTNGAAYFPSVGTTASAANAFLNSGSSPANQLLRSTSSIRYKTDVLDLPDSEAFAVISQMRPITYRSAVETDDQSRRWLGFIAEELAVVDPRLVHFSRDEDGQEIPDGVQYERVTVLLVAALQEALRRLDAGGL